LRALGALQALEAKNTGRPKTEHNLLAARLTEAERKDARLEEELRKAHLIIDAPQSIDVQKVLEMLGPVTSSGGGRTDWPPPWSWGEPWVWPPPASPRRCRAHLTVQVLPVNVERNNMASVVTADQHRAGRTPVRPAHRTMRAALRGGVVRPFWEMSE
jgi:hypothetical protein